MRQSPVDFSKLKKESHAAIEFLAGVAVEGGERFLNTISLPFEIRLHCKNPANPVAIFYLEEEPDEGGDTGLGLTLMDYNESEMFRTGRGNSLTVEVRPANRLAQA